MHATARYVGGELQLFSRARHWKAYFAQQLRPYICGDVLEVGAGLGGTTLVLRRGRERSWTCLEPDSELLQQLTDAWPQGPLRHLPVPQVVAGCVQGLPQEARYDTILYVDVLEHIERDAEELRQAACHLRPQGHLVVLSPAHPWLFSPFDRAIGHFRRYTAGQLRPLTPAGMRLVRLAYLDSVGLLASAANRLLLRSELPTERQISLWDGVMVPCSRILDRLTAHRLGKSVLAVWQQTEEMPTPRP